MRFLSLRRRSYSLQLNLLKHCVEQNAHRIGYRVLAATATPTVFNNYGGQQRHFSSKAAEAPAVKANSPRLPAHGPGLKEFLIAGRKPALVAQSTINPIAPENTVPYLDELDYNGHGRKVFFEVYGCQMNVNDTEIVWSILKHNGYEKVNSAETADIVLLMTCAIREKAETKVCSCLNRIGVCAIGIIFNVNLSS